MKDDPSKVRAGHLDFLDGIRGLSAFYVLLTHAYNSLFYAGIGNQDEWSHRIMMILKPMAFGRYAVDMFIVLSGYCLMLPVAKGNGSLRGGFGGYIKRRATRILPTYYAALILSLLILVARGVWLQPAGNGNVHDGYVPALGDLVSHLLLVHNLFARYAHSINAPMWSVASEWQIYFFFPAILLPVWRRWNMTATVAVALTLGYALHLLVPGGLEGAAPWYIGLFALGMAAATFNFSTRTGLWAYGNNVPWGSICVALMAVLAAIGSLANGWFRDNAWLIDPIFGFAAVSLILHCVEMVSRNEVSPLYHLTVLRSKWVVGLGAFSYSLYLVHYPLVEIVSAILQSHAVPPRAQIAVTFGVGVPVVTGLAYLFHVVFERPFMPGHPHNISQAQVAAAVSPAP